MAAPARHAAAWRNAGRLRWHQGISRREFTAGGGQARTGAGKTRGGGQARARASKPEAKLAAAYMKPITLEFRDAPLRNIFEVIAQVSGLNLAVSTPNCNTGLMNSSGRSCRSAMCSV